MVLLAGLNMFEFQNKLTREIGHWRHDMDGKLENPYHLQRNEQYGDVKKILGEMCGESN